MTSPKQPLYKEYFSLNKHPDRKSRSGYCLSGFIPDRLTEETRVGFSNFILIIELGRVLMAEKKVLISKVLVPLEEKKVLISKVLVPLEEKKVLISKVLIPLEEKKVLISEVLVLSFEVLVLSFEVLVLISEVLIPFFPRIRHFKMDLIPLNSTNKLIKL